MQRTIRLALSAGAAVFMTSCASVTKSPAVRASLAVGNLYAFRGVPQADNGVMQGDVGLSVTDDDGGTFAFTGWGNMNLSNDSGDAIFANANGGADGNGGKFTEIDLIPEYSRTFGAVAARVGIVNYNFPNGVGISTNEVYVAASLATWLNPGLTLYYDVDEVRGLYALGSVSHRWELAEKEQLSVEAKASLGCASSDQGNAYWLDRSAGLADLMASVTVSHRLSPHVVLAGTVAASTIVADDYRDALDAAGIESDNFWFLVGTAWSF